jgi:hypothetical protein
MITKVKCGTKGCTLEGQAIPTAKLFINKIASFEGPFPCPECGEPMAVALRVPDSIKPGAGSKKMPRPPISKPAAQKPVGKTKPKKAMKVKGMGDSTKTRFKKPGTKKAGPKKRGPSK